MLSGFPSTHIFFSNALKSQDDELPDYTSAVGDYTCSSFGEATGERDPLFLAVFGAATTSIPPSPDFAAERDLRPRAGVPWESLTTSTGVGADRGVTAGSTAAPGLRPNPSALAIVERRSE